SKQKARSIHICFRGGVSSGLNLPDKSMQQKRARAANRLQRSARRSLDTPSQLAKGDLREEVGGANRREQRASEGSAPIKPHGASVAVTEEVWHGQTWSA